MLWFQLEMCSIFLLCNQSLVLVSHLESQEIAVWRPRPLPCLRMQSFKRGRLKSDEISQYDWMKWSDQRKWPEQKFDGQGLDLNIFKGIVSKFSNSRVAAHLDKLYVQIGWVRSVKVFPWDGESWQRHPIYSRSNQQLYSELVGYIASLCIKWE